MSFKCSEISLIVFFRILIHVIFAFITERDKLAEITFHRRFIYFSFRIFLIYVVTFFNVDANEKIMIINFRNAFIT